MKMKKEETRIPSDLNKKKIMVIISDSSRRNENIQKKWQSTKRSTLFFSKFSLVGLCSISSPRMCFADKFSGFLQFSGVGNLCILLKGVLYPVTSHIFNEKLVFFSTKKSILIWQFIIYPNIHLQPSSTSPCISYTP